MQACRKWFTRLTSITSRKYVSSIPDCVIVAEEVKSALKARKPVVALETTIITHGMPHPQNISQCTSPVDSIFDFPIPLHPVLYTIPSLNIPGKPMAAFPHKHHPKQFFSSERGVNPVAIAILNPWKEFGWQYQNIRMATEVEQLVRQHGSVPATIGIIAGKVHIGLNAAQLEFLADPSTQSIKTSRRDLSFIISQKLHGGTTVSGTMMIASLVGIPLFVTGGIGGVHRGGETSLDVSADLTELGRTPVTVVSSGVKSILDIGRTLEYLETEGVCVASYGQSQEFPSFFTRQSGHLAPYNVQTATEAAKLIYSNEALRLQSGILIGVPIPEQYDNLGQEIETVIQSVVYEAQKEGITGKEITPFILQRVNDRTAGKSLEANIHLVKNNATVGSQIASELAKLHSEKECQYKETKYHKGVGLFGNRSANSVEKEKESKTKKKVTVVGGSVVDFYAHMMSDNFQVNGATYPGKVRQTFGGVGRNIADGLCRLGVNTCFISAIGVDSHSATFENYCNHVNLQAVQRLEGHSTATYCAVLGADGELLFGIGDMEIHKQITPELVSKYKQDLSESTIVCIDGNIPDNTMQFVCDHCMQHNVPVLFDPADMHKATKPFFTKAHRGLMYATPNFNELKMMAGYLSREQISVKGTADDLDLQEVLDECSRLLSIVSGYIPVILVTLGKHGVVLCCHGDSRSMSFELQRQGEVTMEYFPAVPDSYKPGSIASVSGAGDCMIAALISYILDEKSLNMAVRAGLLAAQISLQSMSAVPQTLTPESILPERVHKYMDVQSKLLK